jgi:hypothetical protein
MTAKELASALNGREYGNEITETEEKAAKEAGLVVVFGYSDDNMEFRGAICDEVSCYDGGTVHLTSAGLLMDECPNAECPYFRQKQKTAATITAVWDTGGYSWTYNTAIPHETFDIMENGETYCCGIVFALAAATEKEART